MRLDADRIKAAVDLSEVAGRVVQWDGRKSKPGRDEFWACCPFHGERTPSFRVWRPRGKSWRWRCYGGCDGGSAIDFAMKAWGLDFREACAALARDAGLSAETEEDRRARQERQARARARAEAEDLVREERSLERALAIWREADPAAPLLESYIAARIGVGRRDALWALFGGPPPVLRTHPRLPARDDSGKVVWRGPVMVGATPAPEWTRLGWTGAETGSA